MHAKPIIIQLAIPFFMLLFFSLHAQVPVSPEPIVITQPNQTKITIIGVGTGDKPYTETVDGYTLLKNKKGIYMYAQLNKNQKLFPSKLKAHNPEARSKREKKCLEKKFKPHLR